MRTRTRTHTHTQTHTHVKRDKQALQRLSYRQAAHAVIEMPWSWVTRRLSVVQHAGGQANGLWWGSPQRLCSMRPTPAGRTNRIVHMHLFSYRAWPLSLFPAKPQNPTSLLHYSPPLTIESLATGLVDSHPLPGGHTRTMRTRQHPTNALRTAR